MGVENTPPLSPYSVMEEYDETETDPDVEIIFEDEVEEIMAGDIPPIDDDDDDEDDIVAVEREAVQDDASIVFTKHEASIFCCHMDPVSGSLAVTGGEDDKAYVWETATGNVVLECSGNTDSVICAEFSRDGVYVATGDMAGTIQVWKLATKALIFETGIGDLSWLNWHHGTNVLFGGTMDGETYMWKMPSGVCKVLPGNGKKSSCGLVLPDGKRVAVGYEDGSLKVFDLKNGIVEQNIPGRDEVTTLTCMDAHSDNNLLLASGEDGKVSLIKSQTGKLVSTLDCNLLGHQEEKRIASVEAVGFCKDNSLTLAATGSLDGNLIIWDISKMVRRHDIKQGCGITKLLWDRNTLMVYTAGLDGIVRRYDARSGVLERQWSGFTKELYDMCLSQDGSTLVACAGDNTARVFNVAG